MEGRLGSCGSIAYVSTSDYVRSSLNRVARISKQRILVLTGPAGTAKTTTLRVLAREMGFEIVEWRNSMNERAPSHFSNDLEGGHHNKYPICLKSSNVLLQTITGWIQRQCSTNFRHSSRELPHVIIFSLNPHRNLPRTPALPLPRVDLLSDT